MTYGQLTAGSTWWPVQARRPARRPMRLLQAIRVTDSALPALEAWSRIATGAAIGGTFGLTTPYAAAWLLVGGGVAAAYGTLRDRYQATALKIDQ